MNRHAVFGSSPTATCLARALVDDGPTTLVSDAQEPGPFLWRKADLGSGEGVRSALRDATHVYVILEDDRPVHGLLAVIRPNTEQTSGVLVVPTGAMFAASMPTRLGWAKVELGVCWGPGEPLVDGWSALIEQGRRVLLADPGVIHVVPMEEALTAIRRAIAQPGTRWRLPGRPARLPDLAADLAGPGRPLKSFRAPLALAMRSVGVDAQRVQRWLAIGTAEPLAPAQPDG